MFNQLKLNDQWHIHTVIQNINIQMQSKGIHSFVNSYRHENIIVSNVEKNKILQILGHNHVLLKITVF